MAVVSLVANWMGRKYHIGIAMTILKLISIVISSCQNMYMGNSNNNIQIYI